LVEIIETKILEQGAKIYATATTDYGQQHIYT
jgi:hypothetical protein